MCFCNIDGHSLGELARATAESQLPGVAVYSHSRPFVGALDQPLQVPRIGVSAPLRPTQAIVETLQVEA